MYLMYVCVCVSAADVKRKTMDLKASERFVQFFQCSMLRQVSNRHGSKHCFPQYRCLLLEERHLSSASNTQTSQSNLATAENSINRCAFCRIVVVVSSNIGLYFSHPTSSINSKLRKNKWPKDCVQCSSIVPQPAIKAWRRAEWEVKTWAHTWGSLNKIEKRDKVSWTRSDVHGVCLHRTANV